MESDNKNLETNEQANNEEHIQPAASEAQKKTEETEQINYKEQFMRLSADLQNLRRRMDKEKAEWTLFAQSNVLAPLLIIFDDLDRAIENTAKNPDVASSPWFEGFILIQKNLKKTLDEIGIHEIEATGDFNPELHEALVQVESADHKSGQVVQLLNKGYTIKGKVLRHAKVSVAK